MANRMKTVVFLSLLTGLLMLFGYVLGGQGGVIFGFLIGLITNLISFWFSDKIVLSMHRATEVQKGDLTGLYETVSRLTQRANMPMPKVYIIPDHTPNAFATGRDPYHSAVAVTQGLLGICNQQELEGVLAHEIAHIRNRDTLISTIAATVASAIMFLANMTQWMMMFGGTSRGSDEDDRGSNVFSLLFMAILAPIAASLIQMAISRSREYVADSTGAELCGNPEWLANALRKIHNTAMNIPMESGSPATAHMYIVNPFSSKEFVNLFSTHPPVESRIEKLLSMQLRK